MKLVLRRDRFTEKSTTGKLYVDDVFQCYTLEDRVREAKIAGKTAIPEGTYTVVINRSPRFGVDMPLLMNVPNFTGIRIHSGNHAGHTDGCILVGKIRLPDFIRSSRVAYYALFHKIKTALDRRQSVTIEVASEKPHFSDMVVTKHLDDATTSLFMTELFEKPGKKR